ncbi:carboxymethylenebutenolidase [Neisseria bacilliformis ATCC BAA-1200]|uniref:Carboxymethylenebutenolidase n=1 Tax=Neisseria bacilliformis ATCC BAA-1200 TaxID=888742 RepID=F2BDR9_9NEIS|nr:carboxymethylenebutenolidase [Neisseria bacilliformis ATCC BAA-1200]
MQGANASLCSPLRVFATRRMPFYDAKAAAKVECQQTLDRSAFYTSGAWRESGGGAAGSCKTAFSDGLL